MPYRFSTARLLTLLPLFTAVDLFAQAATAGSPYSAYGFGDLLVTGQAPSALMGGTGIACSEPFGIQTANPASYAAARYLGSEGLLRPVFQGGVRGLFVEQRSGSASSRRTDAQFMGLNVGIPFGKGRWGLGFGITPFSNVEYKVAETAKVDDATVSYEYTGTGGLSRVFAGVGRVLYQEKPDSLGHLGGRLAIGANFDFLFGSIEQTRKAAYPRSLAYTSISAFSSLVLRAPSGSVGLHYSGAITRNEMERLYRWRMAHVDADRLTPADLAVWREATSDSAKVAWLRKAGWRTAYTDSASMPRLKRVREQGRLERWKVQHVDTSRLAPEDLLLWRRARTDEARMTWLRSVDFKVAYLDSADMPRMKDAVIRSPWRYTLGATASLPTVFNATSTDLVTSFFRGTTGIEAVVDTLPSSGTVEGTLSIPLALGFGLSVYNARWLFTAETRIRDWAGSTVNVEGYSLPSSLRRSLMYAAGARFTPSDEGGILQRATYRAGLRYLDDYLEVRGTPITCTTVSAGVSLPLNAVQTNSALHIGVEYGMRGTTGSGLLEESFTHLWVGVSITPWKRERWFQRYQIQ